MRPHNWKGGRVVRDGYIFINCPGHPRSYQNYVQEHITVAEMKLKRHLNATEVPHHIDENPMNNDSDNIYVCADNAEHRHIHKCLEAYKACGRADWLKCSHCGEYDDPKNMYLYPHGRGGFHRECHNKYERERRAHAAWQRRKEGRLT